ncbi:Spindle pole body component [Fusarium oxysporum f. sp. albedinis]|nr:Spindle pole body component [Fusarium oxysporum f. sp. albedinis]
MTRLKRQAGIRSYAECPINKTAHCLSSPVFRVNGSRIRDQMVANDTISQTPLNRQHFAVMSAKSRITAIEIMYALKPKPRVTWMR